MEQWLCRVWHLEESADGTTDELADASGHDHHATGGDGAAAGAPAQRAAQIDMGQSGDEVDDFVATPASVNGAASLTLSLWASLRTVANTTRRELVGQSDAVEMGSYWSDRINDWMPGMTKFCPGSAVASLCSPDFPLQT